MCQATQLMRTGPRQREGSVIPRHVLLGNGKTLLRALGWAGQWAGHRERPAPGLPLMEGLEGKASIVC